MTTLNTIIEEEKKEFDRRIDSENYETEEDGYGSLKTGSDTLLGERWYPESEYELDVEKVKNFLTTAMQRAYEAGEKKGREESGKRNAVVKEYKDEGVMFILKVKNGKTYEASMPIPKWVEVGKLQLRDHPELDQDKGTVGKSDLYGHSTTASGKSFDNFTTAELDQDNK